MMITNAGAILKVSIIKSFILIILFFIINSCTNPFAPRLETDEENINFKIGDLSSIEGLFKNFQFAYMFRDTLIYGQLLHKDFIFSYRDYEIGADVNWGREDEMRIHNALFQNSKRLDLVWNNILSISPDSSNIIRSFNLTITFNPTDIIMIDGRVNLELKKESNKWKIVTWVDESNY